MKTHILKRRQLLPRPAREIFHFFEKPENLEKITPASVGFVILTPKPIKMQAGTVLDYTIRIMGLPVRWTTLIQRYEPPDIFVDVSIRGPYSFWHHTHTFEETEDGTVMTDEVRYAMPFGFLGRIVHGMWVKKQLNYIFDYRAKVIAELIDSAETHPAGCPPPPVEVDLP